MFLKLTLPYARHTFRQLTQKPGETIQQIVTRLRSASKDCGYGTDTDNYIRDGNRTKCTSQKKVTGERIPFHIRDQVSTKIKKLLDNDIIKSVEGPVSWVNPVVVVPKAGWRGHTPMC